LRHLRDADLVRGVQLDETSIHAHWTEMSQAKHLHVVAAVSWWQDP
jgi:hypothetical protein